MERLLFYTLLQIFIQGHEHLNRAVQGDVVAIEMLPKEQWTGPSSLILVDEEEKNSDDIKHEVITNNLDKRCTVDFHIYILNNIYTTNQIFTGLIILSEII